MDLVTMHPEGLKEIIDDATVEALEDYYEKPISKITQEEIDAYEDVCYERANNL